MKIYFNGDSNVAGTELENPLTQGFAAKLSNKLGATSFINEAYHGASNSLILRRTEAYLNECKRTNTFPDLIVIGWSECTREDWYINGQYCSISSIGLEHPEQTDPESFQYWVKQLSGDMGFRHHMTKFYNRVIHNLHLELRHLGIPHLFFQAIDPFNISELDPGVVEFFGHDPVYRLEWHDSYYHPYGPVNSTWRYWALERNYKQVTDGWYHFDEQCQEDWAQLMYEYIKEKNIV